ncbi:AMP-dependent synthetase [Thalassolituus oleivorans 4BN06-13]|jgi:fatty-acyl-CoA synthase/citronellyl-CoA synthetase|nr:long-chain-acyl-CoA synthetase [Thalassolituus oleivorans]MCA6128984.1 AMP-dependent synthetase [Thalassolituus oleivorans 4BN06-13]
MTVSDVNQSEANSKNTMASTPEKNVSLVNIATQLIGQIPDIPVMLKGVFELVTSKPEKKKSIGLLLEKHARQQPDHIAVRYQDITLTYAQVNERANQMAHFFVSKGISSGDTIAVVLENRPETLVCVFAAVKLGAICSMINTSQRGEVLLHSLNLVQPKLIVVGEEMLDNVGTVEADLSDDVRSALYYLSDNGSVGCPKHYKDLDAACANQARSNPASTGEVRMHQPCYYIFTSGTTGLPKASVMSHYRWFKSMAGMGLASMKLRKSDIMYVSLPLYHNNALTVSLAAVLGAGACIAISRKFSVSRFWDEVRMHNATAFCYIGELCRYLLNTPPKNTDRHHDIRVVVGNGLRPDIWMEFKNRFGIHHINEFYGASECNLVFTNSFNLDKTAGFCPLSYNIVDYDIEEDKPRRDAAGYMIPIKAGKTGLLITEVNDKQPFEGYTDEEASNKKLFRDVFKQGDCWFNTGDLVNNQGWKHVSFADRLGDTFRWKGENVATTEIESVLMEHADIQHAVVYGVEIPHTDGRAGMATITPRIPLDQMDWDSVTRHVRDKLPAYAIPLFLRIREEEEVTGTFKYRKVELKEEAYHLDKVDEPLLVLTSKNSIYEVLTSEIETKINNAEISL